MKEVCNDSRLSYLKRREFCTMTTWNVVDTDYRKDPQRVMASRGRPTSGKRCLFVCGRAANHPFGTVIYADQDRIGRKLAEIICGQIVRVYLPNHGEH